MRSVKKRHMRGACVCLCVCLCALPLLEALAENAAASGAVRVWMVV